MLATASYTSEGVTGVGSDQGGVMEGEGSGSGVVGGGGVREEGKS